MNNAGEAPLVPRVFSRVLSRARRTREARRRERPWDGMGVGGEGGTDLGEGRDVALREGGRAPGERRHHAGRMPGEGFLVQHSAGCSCEVKSRIYGDPILKLSPSASLGGDIIIMAFDLPTGLNSEKVSALIQKLNSDPQFVLAQNVGTTHDLLDICLRRATVQGAQHVFQHVVPQEGKPVTNQKSSGEVYDFLPTLLTAAHFVVLKMALG
jgi:hypothetical protein